MQTEPRSARARLDELCAALTGIEERIEKLDVQRQAIRAELSWLIAEVGTQTIAGFGKLELTSPAVVVSYDRTKLEALAAALRATGQPDLAAAIDETRKESARAGSLRITREKVS